MKAIFFKDKFGITICGGLFLPNQLNSDKKYPSLVINGPEGSVKQQTSGLYASKLSQKGFITLALYSPFSIPRTKFSSTKIPRNSSSTYREHS